MASDEQEPPLTQNRRLTPEERAQLDDLLKYARAQLDTLAGRDVELRFAFNRRLFNKLIHDERGTPMQRRALKVLKFELQEGICPLCNLEMKLKGAELDRAKASLGYTPSNTRLVHHSCHVDDQRKKGFNDRAAPIPVEDLNASNDE